jgi:hypothetical protein
MMYKSLISILLLLGCPPLLAFASGIQVSPAKLEFWATSQQTLSEQLVVANPSPDAQAFQIYATDFPSAIVAEPNDFSLEPGGRRDIVVSVDMQKLQKNVNTKLAVITHPLGKNKNLAVATGVKIPLTIISTPGARSANRTENIAIFALIVAVFLTILLTITKHKKIAAFRPNSITTKKLPA